MPIIIREIIGISASVLITLSYLFQGKKLRLINLIGSVLFVIYGSALGGISIVLLNFTSIFVHLYYLLKEDK